MSKHGYNPLNYQSISTRTLAINQSMSQLWHNPHVYNAVNYQCLKHLNYRKCFLNQYNYFSCNWHLQGFQTSVIETLNWKSRLSDAIFLDTSLISVPDSVISAICQPPWLCCSSLSPEFCLSHHFRHLSASLILLFISPPWVLPLTSAITWYMFFSSRVIAGNWFPVHISCLPV